MIFETHQISSPLSALIESIFYYKDYAPEHNIERVVPTNNIFLIFEFDGIPRHTFDPTTLQPNAVFEKVWISGMQQSHLSISAHPNSEMLVVQFKTAGAAAILHRKIDALNDKVCPADSILGDEILALRDTLKSESQIDARFQLIEQWLLGRLDVFRLAPESLETMLDVFRNNPFTAHAELIRTYPKSQKTLIEHCKAFCGLKPKTLHRIFRFNKLLRVIGEQQELSWSSIAYETGFSDQAHFIKEFQIFSGINPSAFIRNEYHKQMPNFFPINEE